MPQLNTTLAVPESLYLPVLSTVDFLQFLYSSSYNSKKMKMAKAVKSAASLRASQSTNVSGWMYSSELTAVFLLMQWQTQTETEQGNVLFVSVTRFL